ncbi:MAG TPA: type 1 glutamine amidotransferase [Rectinemataceae bacterium]|nr:type 1 glutamine amidotransferase [Rectinemataceae bacterium]
MRILQIEHWPARFPYDNAPFFARRKDRVEDLRIYAGQPCPEPSAYDAVIVYGGYMSAYDDTRNPWIADELRYMEKCVNAGVPLLGICLGSQLLARLLGARVYRSASPEFGFQRIYPTPEGASHPAIAAMCAGDPTKAASSDFLALEWHNDAWDLPAGATRLAESAYWPNEAFSCGDKVLAIQFHLEFTREHMMWAIGKERDSLPQGPGCEDPDACLADPVRFAELARNMETLLDKFLAMGRASTNTYGK